MSPKAVVITAGVAAGISAIVAKQLPEIQRYLRVRQM